MRREEEPRGDARRGLLSVGVRTCRRWTKRTMRSRRRHGASSMRSIRNFSWRKPTAEHRVAYSKKTRAGRTGRTTILGGLGLVYGHASCLERGFRRRRRTTCSTHASHVGLHSAQVVRRPSLRPALHGLTRAACGGSCGAEAGWSEAQRISLACLHVCHSRAAAAVACHGRRGLIARCVPSSSPRSALADATGRDHPLCRP
jgi:hypothetical protein